MALARRGANRYETNNWPGFVDAMTALLLVLVFVLSIFMIMQFVLREALSGKDERLLKQERQLQSLSEELSSLASVLSVEKQRSKALEATLSSETEERRRLDALVSSLTSERDAAQARAASFEDRVTALLADLDKSRGRVAALESDLETTKADLSREVDRKEALQLALSRLRDETDAQTEAARLAAAQADAMKALVEDLRAKAAEREDRIASLQDDLTDQEKQRALEAAAAEALRKKLENADTELTAMTLALEEQRKKAEETLTLLAAAQQAREEQKAMSEELRAELKKRVDTLDERKALLALAQKKLAEAEQQNKALDRERARQAREVALLNTQAAQLRSQLDNLQGLLDEAREKDAKAQVQIANLGQNLNAALARELALKQAEARRLAQEAKSLENYRSEFFGKMREILGDRSGVRIVGDRFVFQSEVLFAPGSAELGAEGRRQLAEVASVINEVSGEIPEEINWILRVDGHTDDVPISTAQFADNWELSQARALSVVKFLSEQEGIPPQRLAAAGFGEYQPVASNDTAEGRARNRRIELKLTER